MKTLRGDDRNCGSESYDIELAKGESAIWACVSKFDAAVVAVCKKAYADNGGDKAKVCAALGLEAAKWVDGGEAAFLSKYFGVK